MTIDLWLMQVTIATLQLTLPTLLGMGVTLGCSMLILCTWTLIAPDHDPLVWERQVLVLAAASDYSICYEMLSDLLISSQEQDESVQAIAWLSRSTSVC